ncbi:hypothetical protein BU26DRAFT_524429 [Trematosphaeria pertusa]|uniref:Mediator of RNA polymerase II transcription subunit 7 n=1 Tax=Trematosphaeria pertusa TaxID=390896 RepID=A0A6A6HY05_9PLEO|nr:uncharacterized protein BU26DRAFT_524429 [Trematosphaeria pertusa]KAF2242250.1 hypothetical protein BU26DRAFT_524429 [Trematosphaeria pertusa]
MAQQPQQDQPELSSFFPDPPPFYKHFTTENQERLKQFKEQRAAPSNDGVASSPPLTASQLLELPTELRYLVPPEPPAEDAEYRVFGEVAKVRGVDEFENIMAWISDTLWDKQQEAGILEGWKYEQLYPPPSASDWSSIDRQRYLFRFLRSVMLSFVELLGVVAVNPTSEKKDEKLRDILTLVLNMHALINEYRPHQARETLIMLMEEQVERKKAEVEGVKKMADKVRQTLEGFAKEAPEGKGSVVAEESVDAEKRRVDLQREMWTAMDEILGH